MLRWPVNSALGSQSTTRLAAVECTARLQQPIALLECILAWLELLLANVTKNGGKDDPLGRATTSLTPDGVERCPNRQREQLGAEEDRRVRHGGLVPQPLSRPALEPP